MAIKGFIEKRENQIIVWCPECKGEGKLVKQWGYCPDLNSEEEQIDILRKCSDTRIDDYEILGRAGPYWTVKCPFCLGDRLVSLYPIEIKKVRG